MNKLKLLYYDILRRLEHKSRLNDLKLTLRARQPIVLVHQMGRAASMTMVNTIRSLGINYPIYHTHWLNRETIKRKKDRFRERGETITQLHIRVSLNITEELTDQQIRDYPWIIISVIRDPVARNISAFFLSIDMFIDNIYEKYDSGELSIEDITDAFLRKFAHDQPLQWFEEEVKQVFDVDVFKYSYDVNQGFQYIENKNSKLLLVKVETLNDKYKGALSSVFGKTPDKLVNTHLSAEEQPYAKIYKAFLKSVHLPEEYLDQMYNSMYAKHFYSADEINNFRERWS